MNLPATVGEVPELEQYDRLEAEYVRATVYVWAMAEAPPAPGGDD